MAKPTLSSHYLGRAPSPIRQAQILFAERPDRDAVAVVNLAIGNVSLPMHPAMRRRLAELGNSGHGFADGVVRYTPSVGSDAARAAFLHLVRTAGFSTEGVDCVITDGGSQAMELMILGVSGPASDRPILLVDPVYTNYVDFAKRVAVPTVAVGRALGDDGVFAPPDMQNLRRIIEEVRPSALVVIPADNPTGRFIRQEEMRALAALCVDYNMWFVSDEAYRQLHYTGEPTSSIWGVTEAEVPGITGRRISIESASKVWNACGLRIGALMTDNAALHAKAVAEYTANLCSNALGQAVFAALADESPEDLRRWYTEQRAYYAKMMRDFKAAMESALPGIIVSSPDASLYSVIDFRRVAPADFDTGEFVRYCAEHGKAAIDGKPHTLLTAPMAGFYCSEEGMRAGRTQVRLAYVDTPAEMRKAPKLLAALFGDFLATK